MGVGLLRLIVRSLKRRHELEHALRPLPASEVGELVGPDDEDRVGRPELLAEWGLELPPELALREVAIAVGEGKVNAQIAEELYMSVATVKSHVSRLLTKLEADTRTHAVAIALREAIID